MLIKFDEEYYCNSNNLEYPKLLSSCLLFFFKVSVMI